MKLLKQLQSSKFNLYLFLFFIFAIQFIFANAAQAQNNKKAEVVLRAKPISIKTLRAGVSVDAVDQHSLETTAAKKLILFKIERVLKGQFIKLKRGGPTKFEQAQQAAAEKNIAKLVSFDYEDPNVETEKGWVSIAVDDPQVAFAMPSAENPGEGIYRIHLQPMPDSPDSFVMTKAVLDSK